jgi:hypothetical protein
MSRTPSASSSETPSGFSEKQGFPQPREKPYEDQKLFFPFPATRAKLFRNKFLLKM